VRTLVPSGTRASLAIVRPEASYLTRVDAAPLSAEEQAALRDGRATAWVRGVVIYEDAARERHHVTFCRVFDAARGWVAPERPGYNYGD
jgi:hypothetical protein